MNYTIYKTNNNNTYLYSFYKQQTILLHPLLEYIINKVLDNQDISYLLMQTEITIENKTYNTQELNHYYKKYLFFVENDFFKEININEFLSGRISNIDVEKTLNSVQNLTFEITEKCNLSCKYCIYGDNYIIHSDRKLIDLDFEKAKQIIDYFIPKWISNNDNFYRKINLGFYGGEALLMFDTIKSIVNYVKKISETTGLKFQFNMTTNGILLHKYIDFLVENDFGITISLDGNEENNVYRVFNNNKPSYEDVIRNINLIKDKFLDYYNKNITFSTVLHDKNNEYQIKEFFQKNYNKIPRCSAAKTLDKKDEELFQYQSNNIYEIIQYCKDYNNLTKTSLPFDLSMFFKNYFGIIQNNYSNINTEKNVIKHFPTGTCFPFSKKVFISAQGNIYPCERINFRFIMGKIDSKNININTNEIAKTYNTYFEKMRKQCTNCYNFMYCQSCFFASIIKDDDSIICPNFIHKKNHSDFLSFYWSFCEKFSSFYPKIIKNFNYE